MMKFLLMIMFMYILIFKNKKLMFCYNICFLMSVMFLVTYLDVNLINGLSMNMGVSKYSYMLILLSFWIIGLMYMCLNSQETMKKMMFLTMLLILLMFFFMLNLMLFYLFFEISLIPIFIVVIYWGYNMERLSASYYLLMYTMLISMPLLVWIMLIYSEFMSMDLNLLEMLNKIKLSSWVSMMILGAFLVKMPMFMFHIWLPKAHVEAPVYGSMILAAILLKLGSYGLVRILMIFMKEMYQCKEVIISIGVVGSTMISLVCLIQIDMKMLIAYSSVVHMNLMLCSLFSFMKMGYVSAYMMMIVHGLCSSGLFFSVNMFYSRTFSRLLMFNKGLVNLCSSLMMGWFLLCASNFSFPISMGFISEIFMMSVLISWDKFMMLYLMMVSFFSGAYSLYLYSFVQQGEIQILSSMSSGSFKEILIMKLHFFPLLIIMINMVMFY